MSAIEDLGNPVLVPKNDHEDATLVSVSSVVEDFPAEDTQNTIRDRVYRSGEVGSVTMEWSLPTSRTVDSFFLFRHTLAGANVRLQAGTFDSGALPANWWTDTDEYVWSTGADPLLSTYPFRCYFDPVTISSYTITFSGIPSLFQDYYQVSTIVLGRAYQYSQPSVAGGYALSMQDITEKSRSLGGSSRSNVGESWRVAVLELAALQDWERSTWLKFKRFLGTGRAFVWSLYPGQDGDVERDNMGLWKFAQIDPLTWEARHQQQRLQLEEC